MNCRCSRGCDTMIPQLITGLKKEQAEVRKLEPMKGGE